MVFKFFSIISPAPWSSQWNSRSTILSIGEELIIWAISPVAFSFSLILCFFGKGQCWVWRFCCAVNIPIPSWIVFFPECFLECQSSFRRYVIQYLACSWSGWRWKHSQLKRSELPLWNLNSLLSFCFLHSVSLSKSHQDSQREKRETYTIHKVSFC